MNPAKLCHRFQSCSVNRCPLTVEYPNQIVLPDDKEKRCDIEKQVRVKISIQFPNLLKHGGLTVREYTSQKRFDDLTPSVKNKMKEMARDRARAINARKAAKVST